MSSGFGRDGVSPCFYFFRKYAACMRNNEALAQALMVADPDDPVFRNNPCTPWRNDYFECLHGYNGTSRVLEVVEVAKTNPEKFKSLHEQMKE